MMVTKSVLSAVSGGQTGWAELEGLNVNTLGTALCGASPFGAGSLYTQVLGGGK